MGEVVYIKDWKSKRFDYVDAASNDMVNEVKNLMSRAYVLNKNMPQLPTVTAREKAVLDALDYTMKAHALAKKHGIAITNHPNGTYSVGLYTNQPQEQ
jgi:hypothetical protein